MQRRYMFAGLMLALLASVFFYLRTGQREQIDFEQVEPIPGYKMEMREPPLRVAMISVLNHARTEGYQSQMVRSLGRLLGRRFVYVDPMSYSGYLELRAHLRKMGEDPERFFRSSYFTYSHDDSLRAVADGLVDGGVIASLTYDSYQEYAPAMLEQVRIVQVLPGSGMGPVVARRDLREADAVQEILLHLDRDPEAKEAMEQLLIDRFVPPQPELYPRFSPEEGI